MRDTKLHLVRVIFKGLVTHPGEDACKASGPKDKERQKCGSFVSVVETKAMRWMIDHVEMEEKAKRGNSHIKCFLIYFAKYLEKRRVSIKASLVPQW